MVHHVPHVRGAEQLTAVRDRQQAGLPGDAERGAEVGRRAAALVVRQAEADDRPRVTGGQARQGARVQWVPGAGGRDDDAHAHPGLPLRERGLVEHDLDRRGQATHERGVAGGIHLQLEAARSLGRIVQHGFVEDPPHRRLGVDHGAGGVVLPLEAEPSAPRRLDLQRDVVGERAGQADAALRRELPQRRGAHRPREVQVQMRLRQRREIAAGSLGRRHARRLTRPAARPPDRCPRRCRRRSGRRRSAGDRGRRRPRRARRRPPPPRGSRWPAPSRW